jgi:WD40 repeat protein
MVLQGQGGQILFVAISRDSRWLVTADDGKTALLWDLSDSSPLPQELPGYHANINGPPPVAMSRSGRWLATGSNVVTDLENTTTVRLWDLTAPEPATPSLELRYEGGVTTVAISPDDRWLVTGSWDGPTRLWDLAAPDPASPSLELPVNAERTAISSDSRWLVTGSRKRAFLWDLTAADPTSSRVELTGHTDAIRSVAISPDGHWVVTGSSDNTARVWDLTAENPASSSLVLRGHQASVNAIVVTPDSRWVITASTDKTVRLWGVDIDSVTALARRLAGRELTPEERKQYMIDGP